MKHTCLRCRGSWETRWGTAKEQPKRCGVCGTRLWRTPRVRAVGAGRPAVGESVGGGVSKREMEDCSDETGPDGKEPEKEAAEAEATAAGGDGGVVGGVDRVGGDDGVDIGEGSVDVGRAGGGDVSGGNEVDRGEGDAGGGVEGGATGEGEGGGHINEHIKKIRGGRLRAGRVVITRVARVEDERQVLVKDPEVW